MDAVAASLLSIFEKKIRLEVPLFQSVSMCGARITSGRPSGKTSAENSASTSKAARTRRHISSAPWSSTRSRRRLLMSSGGPSLTANNGLRQFRFSWPHSATSAAKADAPIWPTSARLPSSTPAQWPTPRPTSSKSGRRSGTDQNSRMFSRQDHAPNWSDATPSSAVNTHASPTHGPRWSTLPLLPQPAAGGASLSCRPLDHRTQT